ncbi:DUF7724 family protein [Phascolarctobacterium sp.]|uniref:DUF7724 family protein n=1 Tax=Phascolarctobacterium sp. TaxID=2049039 RepID=UPI003F7F1364
MSSTLNTAFLSSSGEYTFFKFRDRVITFLTGKRLEKYTKILEWDNGYLVVLCKNKNEEVLEEDYIDLLPILDNLLIEANEFLKPIKEVEISYDFPK